MPLTDSRTNQDGSIQELNGKEIKPPTKKHPVIEIFGPVIQGEGSQVGNQTMFIRFGGCDYRCTKCDSLHAVIPGAIQKHGTMMEPIEIVEALYKVREETGVRWVTFSGGNPCMHKLDELVAILVNSGWFINVETQGTLWQDWLLACTLVTISPKSPGMGEKFEEDKFRNFCQRISGYRPVCIKVVVFSEQDLEFALFVNQVAKDHLPAPLTSFYLSLGNPYPPVLDEEMNLKDNPVLYGEGRLEKRGPSEVGPWLFRQLLSSYQRLSEEVLQDPRLKDFRFLPQLHVLVYGNETGR